MKTHRTVLASMVVLLLAIWIALGAMAGAEPEPDIYGAPICCYANIPGCYCWPWGDSWPEPPCPAEFDGQPMVEVPESATYPAFCAVLP